MVETQTISVEQVSSSHQWGWDHFKQCPIYADASTPQPKNKFDKPESRLNNFESELAKSVFKNEALFLPALDKISKAMLSYLRDKLAQAEKISPQAKEKFIQIAGAKFSVHSIRRDRILAVLQMIIKISAMLTLLQWVYAF